MEIALFVATVSYIVIILALALFARKKVHSETDFIAAGRRLPTFFSSATLFATWFGAGTLLTATDAIYEQGLFITALEPYGAGCCLLLAGLFFARPLWNMGILTVPDLFRLKFGKRAEKLSAVLLVPGYFGWIAVQITALSGIVHMYFGIPVLLAMILVTAIATILACLGGMWSVTLTDAVQMALVAVVIVILAYVVLLALGHGDLGLGMTHLFDKIALKKNVDEALKNPPKIYAFFNIFAIAALGNLPGQDLAQRIFSAKSDKVARRSCFIAGFFYMFFGSISIVLGIAARSLLPEQVGHSVIPHLARAVLHPGFTVLLILAIFSIILSTMDSAMLATSSIISHNLLKGRFFQRFSKVFLCRICVVMVAGLSLLLAFVGKSAYSLLEQSYAISLACLFAPFVLGMVLKRGQEVPAIVSMLVGMTLWSSSFFYDSFFASELFSVFASFASYGCASIIMRVSQRQKTSSMIRLSNSEN